MSRAYPKVGVHIELEEVHVVPGTPVRATVVLSLPPGEPPLELLVDAGRGQLCDTQTGEIVAASARAVSSPRRIVRLTADAPTRLLALVSTDSVSASLTTSPRPGRYRVEVPINLRRLLGTDTREWSIVADDAWLEVLRT